MANSESKKTNKTKKRQAAKAAAIKKQRRDRMLKGGVGLAFVLGVVAVITLTGGDDAFATEPTAWNLPAMGPTADVQDEVALSDFEGKPTVVNFFASWCTACDAELPGFRRVSEQYGTDVHFVGIASQETGDELLMPLRHGVSDAWVLARDVGPGNGGLSRAMGARGMPLTAFYAADGELLHIQLGALQEDQLRATMTQFFGADYSV